MLLHNQLRTSCVVGLCISLYALHISTNGRHGVLAMCDISETISCGKVLRSEYVSRICRAHHVIQYDELPAILLAHFYRFGRGFGIMARIFGSDSMWVQSNSLIGVVYYPTIIVLSIPMSDTI